MSKNTKILIAIATFLPILGIIYYMFNFFKMFFAMTRSNNLEMANPDAFMSNFASLFIIMGISMLIGLAMLVFYIYHIVNNKKLDQNDRLVWILVVLFASSLGCLVYWYSKIWQDDDLITDSNS